MTKMLKIGPPGFHCKVTEYLSIKPGKFRDEIRRGYPSSDDRGTQTRVWYFSTSRRYISETVRDRAKVIIEMKAYMGLLFLHKSMTSNGQYVYAVTGNQKLICYGRNVRLMLILLTHLCTTVWKEKEKGRMFI